MQNIQNMSGEQLLLARIFNTIPHNKITAELNRRRIVAKATTQTAAKAA
jgi:hypothetical protein